ncbi:hypothetical protein GIB67_026341 [Kingdonia uniflora]|uniref:Uncharacterized protein n=1 Tax=Kingdonia uniflora TaxID=39325 RepID=A0A7J7P6A8_9MAGN|nr:hypothetical protein GIB67_026341 [Kingdonia uniflora]
MPKASSTQKRSCKYRCNVVDIIKFLEGKEPELHASRQAGLLDFIASALLASHTSKPEACQIAASLNLPVGTKTSIENFESVSEVLEGFLWTTTTIIGHTCLNERHLKMKEGLLELVITYQVIHRLRDLLALYDRSQCGVLWCLNDGTPEVRDVSFSVLAAIAKLVGMRPLERSLEKLDEVIKKKLVEMIGNSEGAPHPVTESSFPRKSTASMLSGKKPVQASGTLKSGSAKSGASRKGEGSGHSKATGSVELEHEDVEEKFGTMTTDDYFTKHPELEKKFENKITNDYWGY